MFPTHVRVDSIFNKQIKHDRLLLNDLIEDKCEKLKYPRNKLSKYYLYIWFCKDLLEEALDIFNEYSNIAYLHNPHWVLDMC